MSIKRLTKDDIRKTSGVLNPVGHAVLAFQKTQGRRWLRLLIVDAPNKAAAEGLVMSRSESEPGVPCAFTGTRTKI